MTAEEKQDKLKKRREAYKQKKATKDSIQKQKKCAHERMRYANMLPEQKKTRIEQINAKRPCNVSIAMENPGFIATDKPSHDSPPVINVRKRKHVTPGERQALLARRNEKFIVRQDAAICASSDENISICTENIRDEDHLKQPEATDIGNILNCIRGYHIQIKLPSAVCTLNHFSCTDNPSPMCRNTQDEDAQLESANNNDDGMVLNCILVQMQ